ncbi:uncharacterized protein LOC125178545 [Hyalella azteca]|uniref:Uncharacterized protein LOC125178545 n=1 Tax=Hyalella azteca TaxID=294128 RepID=A0A979FQ12_HYAAZ|nr:uncharacterized protein LOC125178545 [Hyalella azteca]
MGSHHWTTFAVISLIAARVTAEADCQEGRAAEKLLLHFQQDAPRGLPGLDLPPWMPLMTPLQVGPVTLLDTRARGLNDLVLHDLHVLAHNFTGSVKLSLPMLLVEGVYEIPGLWWTTTGHFNLTLTNISADTTISIAVLPDGCFYVYDYQCKGL